LGHLPRDYGATARSSTGFELETFGWYLPRGYGAPYGPGF
jgi:hypothetical protein